MEAIKSMMTEADSKAIITISQMIVAAAGVVSQTWNDFGTVFEIVTGMVQLGMVKNIFDKALDL